MRAVIRLEMIGDDFYWYSRRNLLSFDEWLRGFCRLNHKKTGSWIARITGFDPEYGYKREFLRGHRDYSQANSKGSRGIFVYYPLREGVYEVYQHTSWKNARRYFVQVEGAEYHEITKKKVDEWLRKNISE